MGCGATAVVGGAFRVEDGGPARSATSMYARRARRRRRRRVCCMGARRQVHEKGDMFMFMYVAQCTREA